jgi:hypothetical protein
MYSDVTVRIPHFLKIGLHESFFFIKLILRKTHFWILNTFLLFPDPPPPEYYTVS